MGHGDGRPDRGGVRDVDALNIPTLRGTTPNKPRAQARGWRVGDGNALFGRWA